MTKNKTTLEVIAPTVEEAIEKGLEQLGVERKDVEVEVLDEGKRNLFRFASKQARIKLTVLENNNEVKVVDDPEKADETLEDEDELSFGELFEAETAENNSQPLNLELTDVEEVARKNGRASWDHDHQGLPGRRRQGSGLRQSGGL